MLQGSNHAIWTLKLPGNRWQHPSRHLQWIVKSYAKTQVVFEADPREARQRMQLAWSNRRAKPLSCLITVQPPPSPAGGMEVAAGLSADVLACMRVQKSLLEKKEASKNDYGKHGSQHLHGALQFINTCTYIT